MKSLISIVFMLVSIRCLASDAFISVSGGQAGHGIFELFNQNCYVILPAHILRNPGNITVVADGGARSSADIFYYPADSTPDLAILRLPESNASMCHGASLDQSKEQIDALVNKFPTGVLLGVSEDGSRHASPLAMKDMTKTRFTFNLTGDEKLEMGMSGSTLSVGGEKIGMLYSISGQVGNAYRNDFVREFWERLRPRTTECRPSCSVDLSALTVVKNYETTQDLGDSPHSYITYYDTVFRMPENWPFPKYFHAIKFINVIEEAAGVDPIRSRPSYDFSFSNEMSERSSEVGISAIAFDITGTTQSLFQYDGKWYNVVITASGGSQPSQMHLQIKALGP